MKGFRAVRALVAVVTLVAAPVLLVACGQPSRSGPAPPARVRIAAASDLNAALGDMAVALAQSRNIDVTVSYGSSGTFYAQLSNQAPFDMFLSADSAYPQQLTAQGLTVPGSQFTYGTGRIVVWTAMGAALAVETEGLESLTSERATHVAIANPDHAPYGRAAVAAMTKAGVYDRVRPKLVFGESVAQALQFVDSGAAEVGIVALSLALAPTRRGKGRWFEIPSDDYPPIQQSGVILKWAKDVEAARAVRAYILSAEGRTILERYGFFVPQNPEK